MEMKKQIESSPRLPHRDLNRADRRAALQFEIAGTFALLRESCFTLRTNEFLRSTQRIARPYDKVAAGERISEADALRLFESKDLNAVGAIADLARQKKTGNRASYIINRYINYSNYCILSCQFCSFARKKRDADGFELPSSKSLKKAREALKLGITELHIVGGLHPSLPFSYYTDMLKALSALDGCGTGSLARSTQHNSGRHAPAELHLKCFTAIEILHLAWLAKKSVEQTLIELKAAGLDSLTGGGAEIFRKEVRSAIAKGKESAEEYLDVHRTWHKLGGRSTCTMLYGHVESLADRVDHLRQLRALQDETHGFVGFVPLPYQPENNDIPVKTRRPVSTRCAPLP